MALNLSLGLFGQSGGGNSYTATIASRTRSGVVYDSGAARGLNSADIPASGTTTAPDGTSMELRLVRSDTGAGVQGWQTATTASGGAWSGTYTGAQRSPHVLEIEARPVGSLETPARTTQGIKIGHVTVQGGASNTARLNNSGFDSGTPADISGNTRVSVILAQSPTAPGSVTDNIYTSVTGQCTSHTSKLIKTLMDGAPNDFFAVAFDAHPGTGWKEAFNNNAAGRDFSTTQLLFDYLQDDGANIGIIYMEFASGFQPGVLDQDEALARFCFAKDIAGNAVAAVQGSNFANFDCNYNINYTFQSLITGDQPVFLMADVSPPAQESTAATSGDDANDWIASLSFQAAFPDDVKVGLTDKVSRRNNYSDPHIDETDDGFGRVAAAYGYATLAGLGLVTPPTLVVEEVTASHVRLSSPQGNITTLNRMRNGGAATNFASGDAEVLGIYGYTIPGYWPKTEIRTSGGAGADEGEVWILPNGPDIDGDSTFWVKPYRTITFDGPSNDWDNNRWQNYMVVDLGGTFTEIEGIMVQTPDNAEFIQDENGLPATLTWTVSSGTPDVSSAANMGGINGYSGWTIEAIVKRGASNLNIITGDVNNTWTRIYVGGTGEIGVRLTGGAGDLIDSTTAVGLAPQGVVTKIRVAIEMAGSGQALIYVDDSLVDTFSFIDNARSHTGNQLARIGRVSDGEFAQVRMWREFASGGAIPGTTPWFRVDAQADSPFYNIVQTGA